MKFRSLKGKMFVQIALAVFAVFIAVGLLVYFGLRTAVTEGVRDDLVATNRFVESALRRHLEERARILRAMGAFFVKTGDFQFLTRQADRLSLKGEHRFIRVIAPDGLVLHSTLKEDEAVGKRLGKKVEFSSRKSVFYIAPVLGGHPYLHIEVPITNGEGEIVYIFGLYEDIHYLQKRIFSMGWIGKTGETYLVSRDGYMLTQSRFLSSLKKAGILPSDAVTTALVLKVVEPESGQLTYAVRMAFSDRTQRGVALKPYRDYRGVPVVGAWIYFPELNAALITEESTAEAYMPVVKTARLMGVGFVFLLFVVWLVVMIWVTGFVKRINLIKESVNRIASGNLAFEPPRYRGYDELSSMVEALEKMLKSLRDSVSKITNVSESLTAASSEVSESVNVVSRSVQDQVASMEEISSSVEEILNSLKLLNERAREVESLAIKARDEAQQGRELMDDMMESVRKAQETSSRVNQIILIIKDMAEQTNLLALNASIEAARAGEAGKGFAVVAEEISKLATNASQAAKEIESLLKQSQSSTEDAFGKAQTASSFFNSIVEVVDRVSSMIREFVSSFDEQTRAMDEVGRSVDSVTRASQEINQQIEELSAVAENLDSLAGSLNELVVSFVLERESAGKEKQVGESVKDITPL